MSIANVTHESLSTQLDKEIPEVYVVIAKHRVAGVDVESIAEIIGCEPKDVDEVESDPLFVEVRQVIGAMVAASQADQGLLWDAIEEKGARRLLERLEYERDTEFLLKAAATANRMTRRNQTAKGGLLDPGVGGKKAAVTLTRRMIEKITSSGHRTVVEEQQFSIHDGTMQTPSFDEVDGVLGIKPVASAKRVTVGGEGALSIEQLDQHMQEKK